MLRRFCLWQANVNEYDDASVNHHDTALLLTRENICRNPSEQLCETLGLAELGTMCQRHSSCAIVQDNGLSAAFTIAHELGHVLNMPHDDDFKCMRHRNGSGDMNNVMSKTLDVNTYPWSWSACSSHFLTEYLEAGNGDCLMDRPFRDFIAEQGPSDRLPGENFTEDRQCELVFGPGSKICSYMPVCKRLWCTTDLGEQEGCRTQHMPWADGTPCGEHHWCQRGECVPTNRTALKPVNGGWGLWKGYEPCSRTCGGGVTKKTRICNSPPPSNGGRYCVGRRVKYRSCGNEECPPGTRDAREEQCAAFNNNNFNIPGLPKNVKWVPKYGVSPDERCKLYCRVSQSAVYYPLKEKVIDGTTCGPETFDMCVNGLCRAAGCDHSLGSTLQLDICGRCGGDNSSCELISGKFNISKYGYNHVVRIPAGSSNLDIRQHAFEGPEDDQNFLALVDGETGEYILNGNFIISVFPKIFLFAGTTLEYSGSNVIVERLNTSRPLKRDLVVMVLSVGAGLTYPPDVSYEYTVLRSVIQDYTWETRDKWTACDRVCGGQRFLKPVCIHIESREEVSDSYCRNVEQPQPEIETCNLHCTLKWNVWSKSECSTNCGRGYRTLRIQCVKEIHGEPPVPVHNHTCTHLSKPSEMEECDGGCDVVHWAYGEWSECSKTCGGVRTRSVWCANNVDEVVDSEECDRRKQNSTSEICGALNCPQWVYEEWTPCSVSCGVGIATRRVSCKTTDGESISDEHCSDSVRPSDEEPCVKDVCLRESQTSTFPSTSTTTSFSASGSDLSNAHYHPMEPLPTPAPNIADNIIPHVDENIRSNNIPLRPNHLGGPLQSDEHHSHRPYTIWKTSSWDLCSVTCGEGVRRRAVFCYNEQLKAPVDRHHCSRFDEPNNSESCLKPRCAKWTVENWGQCSVMQSCGKGTQTRKVTCVDPVTATALADSRACLDIGLAQPSSERSCEVSDCVGATVPTTEIGGHRSEFEWKTGRWGQCSTTCGEGVLRRQVVCLANGNESGLCDTHQRPVDTIPCPSTKPCPTWNSGEWSECSRSCGEGYQKRQVRCVDQEGNKLPEQMCPKEQPKTIKECSLPPCSRHVNSSHRQHMWRTGQWSPCSQTGIQRRKVVCVNRLRRNMAARCDPKTRPADQQACVACHTEFCWRTGEWQPCCSNLFDNERRGRSRQTRKLFCYNKNGNKVSKMYCQRHRKPNRRRKCNTKCAMTCRNVQQMFMAKNDGEYPLYMLGRNVSVYCHNMATNYPTEYISLHKDNFAEIYDRRLLLPHDCPNNGERIENCPRDVCVDDVADKAGLTHYSKIRLNVTSLRVNSEDFQFARSRKGNLIRYGEAGDCYSNKECPQGTFKVDLRGTELRVSRDTRWVGEGNQKIDWRENDQLVIGKCGGYCGSCNPAAGLRLDVLPP